MSDDRINWLRTWVVIDFQNLNAQGVRKKKDHVELLVRGHLHLMDEQDRANPNAKHLIEFDWDKVSEPGEPELYRVRAFLTPEPVETNGGGANLTPTPPPQPPPPPIDP